MLHLYEDQYTSATANWKSEDLIDSVQRPAWTLVTAALPAKVCLWMLFRCYSDPVQFYKWYRYWRHYTEQSLSQPEPEVPQKNSQLHRVQSLPLTRQNRVSILRNV